MMSTFFPSKFLMSLAREASLAELALPSEVNALVGQYYPGPVFFVSYSTEKVARDDVVLAYQQDASEIRRLKSFGSFDARIGMHRLGGHLLGLLRQLYQRSIGPALLTHVQSKMAVLVRKLQTLDRQATIVEPRELRSFSSHYLMEYLQALRATLDGVAGDPSNNGETLEDEREVTGMGQGWVIDGARSRPILTEDPPAADERLLGRPAFGRLFADFDMALKEAPLATIDGSMGPNSGPARSGVAADFAHAVTDIAAKQCRDVLRPLQRQALARAEHIAKNLTQAAESALQRRKGWQTNATGDSLAILRAPFFLALVNDMVHDFIDLQAARCAAALEADFVATANFVPVATNLFSGRMPQDELGELQRIKECASTVLDTLRAHFRDNTKLKLHEYLIDPLFLPLQSYVLSRVSLLHPDDIEAAFEPEATKARLVIAKTELEEEMRLENELVRIVKSNLEINM
jgi:hypothetical protein